MSTPPWPPPALKPSRRGFLTAAGGAGTLALLAACGSEQVAPVAGGPAPLNLWTHDEGYQTFFEGGIAAADAATGFRYSLDTTRAGAQDLVTKLLAQAVAGRGTPDLMGFEIGNFSRMQRGDLAERLLYDWNDRVADLGDDLIAARRAPWTVDGKLHALDSDTPMTVYYRREELFEQYGLPTEFADWDDLAEVGAQAHAEHGVSLGAVATGSDLGQVVQIFLMLLLQRGGALFDADQRLVLDSEVAVDTLQYVVDGLGTGFITEVSDFYGASMQAALKTGKVAGLWMASWYSAFGLKPNVPEQSGSWRVAALPRWADGGFATAVAGGTGFTAIVDQPSTEAAADFLAATWLSPQGQVRRFQELTYLPTLRSVFDSPELEVADEFFGGQQVIDVYRGIVDDIPDYSMSPDLSILNDVLSGYLVQAYRGDVTPAQAISGAAEDFRNQAER